MRDGDEAVSRARRAGWGRFDRLAALAVPHARGPAASRADLERDRGRGNAHPRRDAHVRAELPRARVRAGGAQRAAPRGRTRTGTGALNPLAQASPPAAALLG